MSWTLALGWLAAALTLFSFFQKTMIPARAAAMAANVRFGINEMKRLTEKVRVASQGDLTMDWLKPFVTKRSVKKGEVLLRKELGGGA